MPPFRRTRRLSRPDVEQRINHALDDIRPMLRVESFTVELVRFDTETRVAHLRVEGGCPDCEMTPATLAHGIEARLRQSVPEVESVEAETPGN